MNHHSPTTTPNLSSLIDDAVLDEAWDWLCWRRRDYPASADIWWLRQDWYIEKQRLCQQLEHGNYQFAPLQKLTRSDGEAIELWTARDALVLKTMAIVLGDTFEVSDRCTHIKGHGGAKYSVRQVAEALDKYRFVFRTDVKSFYASIDHHCVYEQLCERVKDVGLLRLLWQYLRRTVEMGGSFCEIENGISLGCPLSPLIGAICLAPIDDQLTCADLFYCRFMDDWVVLTKTRRQLRRAVRITNKTLSALKLAKHPDKTFVGLIKKGFDFLGYYFSAKGVQAAQSTLNKFREKMTGFTSKVPLSSALGITQGSFYGG